MNAHVTVDFNTRVAQYVALRDKINEMKERHKAELKPYMDVLDGLNAVLLQHLNATNSNSVATDAGTAYKTEKRSASIADGEAFMRYVIGGELWDLLDRKANVTAVDDHIKEHGVAPPGVNFSTRVEVGVRRAK